ncbi:MAG: pilus assembly protein PilE [Burkholderiaceae bacterium]|jgi:type IV pilus assembly protein PilE|nr:pilus assembly protein PilE [Burkholderiaceae bacterium]
MSVSVYKLETLAHASGVRGFTLIELLVVMVIAGILAAIAIPNYSEYVVRSNRSAAQSFIANVASRQAQFFLDRRTYATTVAALNLPVPAEVATRYAFAIDVQAGPPLTYTVTATPTGPQVNDRCGALTINQAGNKTAAGPRCW